MVVPANIRIRATRWNQGNPLESADLTQNHNNMAGTSNKPIKSKFLKEKSMFSTLTVKRSSQKFVYGGCLTEFAGLTQNHKRIIGIPNQLI
jgi:hypothetical protein